MFTLTTASAVRAVLCILVVWFIIWFVVCAWMDHNDFLRVRLQNERLEALYTTANAELEWQKLARKAQEKKYDELYSAMMRVNQENLRLSSPKMLTKTFNKELGDEVYRLYIQGCSRKELAKKYGISYSYLCNIIRQRVRLQDPLF